MLLAKSRKRFEQRNVCGIEARLTDGTYIACRTVVAGRRLGKEEKISSYLAQEAADSVILTAGRARAALGCGNPGVMKARRKAFDLPCFWVGEPVTYVQAPDAKGHRSRVTPAFQLPDHGL